MKIRLIAIMLLLAMSVMMFVSCGGGDDTTAPGGTRAPVTTNENYLHHGIEYDGDGAKVKFLSQDRDWYYDELTLKPEEVVNVIDESVRDRELYVEDELNVDIVNDKIVAVNYSTVTDQARTLFDSQDTTYDFVMNSRTGGGNGAEIFWNLYEVDNVDLSMPWYNQGWVESNHNDQVTAICGDATLSLLRLTFVTMCNNTILAEYGVTNIYDDVTNGTWTIDREFEIVNMIYDDANNNNAKDLGDKFGFVTNTCTAVDPYWSAFRQKILSKDENGEFYFDVDTDSVTTATDKVNNLFHNSNGTLILPHQAGTDGEYEIAMQGFASDLYAFGTFRLIAVESEFLIGMESPYGILPMPKLDTDQTEYGSFFHDMHSLIGIMGTLPESRLPLVGAVLEVFSAYSYNETRGVYLDTALKGRYFRDQQSRDVLDIVVNSIIVDTGWTYSGVAGGVAYFYRTMIEGNKNNWAASIRSKKPIYESELKKFNAGEIK